MTQDIGGVDAHAPELMRERARLLYQHSPYVLGGNLVTSTGVAIVLWNAESHARLGAWALSVWLVSALRWWLRVRFWRLPADFDGRRWAHNYMLFAGISGCVWGAAGILLFQPSPLALMVLVVVFAGMAAGSVSSHSTYLPAYIAYVVPTITPFALQCIALQEPFYVVVGVLSLAFLLVNIYYGRNIQRTQIESIRLRFSNLDLMREHCRLKDQAEAARKVAEQANAAKTMFLAAASHDLRQQTQVLEFFTHVLAHDMQNPSLRPLVDDIRAVGHSLQIMLDSLLDVSRIEAAAVRPDLCHFAVGELLVRAGRDFAQQAQLKGLRLRVVATRAWVHSDPLLLERILCNFVSNALKFTTQGGVLIGCRRAGDHLRIEVHDSGTGIPESHQKEIFREFHQLGSAEGSQQGLGLGLAIAEGLARVLGHPLALRSQSNRGSVFSIAVPIGVRSETTAIADTSEPDDIAGRSVLLIDDDQAVRESATAIMERFGCVVVVAESAEEALDLMRASGFVPDAILADYHLRGDITGMDAIRAINDLCGRPVPAAVMTGDTAPERLHEVQASGLFLAHKPFSGAKLRALLSNLLIPPPLEKKA